MRADDPLRSLMPWLSEEKGQGTRSEEPDELVQALKGLAAAEGADVTMRRFLKQTGISEHAVYKHFASWSELRAEAGLAPRRRAGAVHADDDLLAEAVRVIKACGGLPTIREFNERSRYSYHTLYMRFGGRAEILRRCEEYRSQPRTNATP